MRPAVRTETSDEREATVKTLRAHVPAIVIFLATVAAIFIVNAIETPEEARCRHEGGHLAVVEIEGYDPIQACFTEVPR